MIAVTFSYDITPQFKAQQSAADKELMQLGAAIATRCTEILISIA